MRGPDSGLSVTRLLSCSMNRQSSSSLGGGTEGGGEGGGIYFWVFSLWRKSPFVPSAASEYCMHACRSRASSDDRGARLPC